MGVINKLDNIKLYGNKALYSSTFDGTTKDFASKLESGAYMIGPDMLQFINIPSNLYNYGCLVLQKYEYGMLFIYFPDAPNEEQYGGHYPVYANIFNFSNTDFEFKKLRWVKL